MTFKIKVRGDHSAPMMQDFLCDNCGPISAVAPRDVDGILCPDGCGRIAVWVMSAPASIGVRIAEVVRGGVARQERPEWLSTRELAEGMSMQEWRAKRDKVQEEKRHVEAKEFDRFCKGVV